MKWWTIVPLVLAVLLVGTPAQAQEPTPLPERDVRIVNNQPRMSAATFQQVLAAAQSDAAPQAQALYDIVVETGIEPSFFLAIFKQESLFGTASTWSGRKPDGTTTHNPGNLACGGGWPCYNGLRDYPDWQTGTQDWAGTIAHYYLSRGRTTVQEIIEAYAPEGENDTQGYIGQVLRDMATWEGATVPDPETPDDAGGRWTAEYWVEAPMDGGFYRIMQLVASLAWFGNRALFMADESVRQGHAAFVNGFTEVLAVIGTAVHPTLQAIGIVSLTVAALALILAPFFTQQITSVRRAVLALACVPLVMTAAGSGFRMVEEFRSAFADTLAVAAGGRAAMLFDLDMPAVPGTSSMGAVQPYYTGQTVLGTLDIAAAYLFATRDTVYSDVDLPPTFARTYFTAEELFASHATQTSWPTTPKAERDRLNALAQRGVMRAWLAFGVTIPALVERLVQFMFTVNVGIVAINLLLVVPFLVLDTYAGLALHLLRQLPQLIVVSGVIGILQAIMTAFLLIVARGGNIWVVGIAGIIDGVLLALALGVLGFLALRSLVALASTTITGGLDAARDVGRVAVGGIAGAVAGTVATGRLLSRLDAAASQRPRLPSAVRSVAEQARGSMLAYHAAREAGHSEDFAVGYAMSGNALGRTIGHLGIASGSIGGPHAPEMERGFKTGVVAGREDPSSLRSLLFMRQMPKRPQVISPGQTVGRRYAPPQDVTPPLLAQGPLITPAPADGAIQPSSPSPTQPPGTPRGAWVYQPPAQVVRDLNAAYQQRPVRDARIAHIRERKEP